MNHRHLLPTEIDLLLDDEEGFGVAPLRAHVRDCADCQERLDEARAIVDALEELPLFSPSHRFADEVMARVPVFVPWHVAVRDELRAVVTRWVPRSRPARIAVLALGASTASVLTAVTLWILTQGDLIAFATGLVGQRVPALVGDALRELMVALFGPQVLTSIQQAGLVGLGLALAAFVAAGLGTALGLRRIAAASSRRRA